MRATQILHYMIRRQYEKICWTTTHLQIPWLIQTHSNGERVAHSEIAAEIGSWPRKRETAARACGVIRRSSQRAVNRLMFRQSRLMIDWRKRRHRTFSRAAAIFVLPIILLLVPVSRTCILVEYCPRRVYGLLEGKSDDEVLEVFGSECLCRRWNVDVLDGTQELHSTTVPGVCFSPAFKN